jgi:putative ABC transport system permease protein
LLKVGDEASLQMGHRPVTFRVVGTNHEPFSPATAYVSRAFFDTLGGGALAGKTNSVRLVVDPKRADADGLVAVKGAFEDRLLGEGLRPASIAAKGERRVGFDEHMRMIYVFLVVVSAILGGVGALGLMTTMSLSVLERRRELGVLRAIGASPRAVAAIILAEASVVVVLSFLLSVLVAGPLSRGLGNHLLRAMFRTDLDFAFDGRGPAVWIAVSLALAALASALPAWRASRLSVREALTHE